MGSTVPRMIFCLISRLDEAPLTAGVGEACGGDEESESESVDDDDERVDDDGDREVPTTSVADAGFVGASTSKPQSTSPNHPIKELATV